MVGFIIQIWFRGFIVIHYLDPLKKNIVVLAEKVQQKKKKKNKVVKRAT